MVHGRLLRERDEQRSENTQMELNYYCNGGGRGAKKAVKPKFFRLILLSFFVTLTFVSGHRLLFCSSPPSFPFPYSIGDEEDIKPRFADDTIYCDRTTSFRSDVCYMKGDIRTSPSSSTIFLYTNKKKPSLPVEKIRPYTRKWEKSIMATINELSLSHSITGNPSNPPPKCDVEHKVPAVVFSTGGYTGNLYHEFNDGIIPIYVTSRGFKREVVFLILEYRNWWVMKYRDILSQLSNYPPIDFFKDNRTHCFPEVVVGLRIHDELSIDPFRIGSDYGRIWDFREVLNDAYWPRIKWLDKEEKKIGTGELEIPKVVIVSRNNGSRGIENENDLVKLCEDIGFQVQVIRPDRTTELAKIYQSLNNTDAMIGVHGAAMTHLLFLQPGSVLIQIIPLGTDWAAENYYGEPAKKMGLEYVDYKILPRESSLFSKYSEDDPVLKNPRSVTAKGWRFTKEVYLEGQNVKLDLDRFSNPLTRTYHYVLRKKKRKRLMGLGLFKWNWIWYNLANLT